MESKEYFAVPTQEEMRNRKNIQILESTDAELFKLYDEATQGIWTFGGNQELSDDFKKDKELIMIELKNRGLRMPNWLYKIGLYLHVRRA